MLTMILILIFIISVASTWWFGLWSNLLTLVNLLLSALIATSFYQNLLFQMNTQMPTYAVLLPFISVWLLFVLSFIIFRALTDSLSGLQLKFDKITELTGRSLLALTVAWVLVCFVSFTLQMAPLPTDLFKRKSDDLASAPRTAEEARERVEQLRQRTTRASEDEVIGPDRLWVNFIRNRSEGSLSYTVDETAFFPAYPPKMKPDGEIVTVYTSRVFDPDHWFFFECQMRRSIISKMEGLRIPTR